MTLRSHWHALRVVLLAVLAGWLMSAQASTAAAQTDRPSAKPASSGEVAPVVVEPLEGEAGEGEAGEGEAPASDEPFVLRYKFRKGEQVVTKVTHVATTETKIRGNTQQSRSRAVSTKLWRIVDIDEKGSILFEHLVSDVEMWQKVTGREEIRWSSKDEEIPREYEHVAATIGTVISEVKITPTGEILERKNNLPENDMGLGPIATPLPDKPVTVGHRWTAPSEVTVREGETFKRIQTRKQFKLLSVKSGIATIQVQTQVITPVTDPKIEAQLVQQLTNGTIKFDIDAGRIVSKRMDWDETVVGFSGADSLMEYLARFTEEVTPAAQTARRP